jgi:uncharacterized protein YndB with AHSA1/START domain
LAFAENSRSTTASPDRVWAVWSDPARWGEWNPDVREMRLEGPFQAGTQATMHTTAGRTHRMELVEVTAPRRFVLETRVAPGMRLRFRCSVDPEGAGSRIAQAVEMSGPLGALAGRRAAPKIAEGFAPILQALAERAETGDAAQP